MPIESAIKWVILSKRAWPAESSASVPRKRLSSLRLLVPVVSSMGGAPLVFLGLGAFEPKCMMQGLYGKFHIFPINKNGNLDF